MQPRGKKRVVQKFKKKHTFSGRMIYSIHVYLDFIFWIDPRPRKVRVKFFLPFFFDDACSQGPYIQVYSHEKKMV